jgi:Aminotransferase class-V
MIYFDNAATSWPKPEAVRLALNDYFGEAGGNPGRSGHRMSVAAARVVETARESIADFFHADDPSCIVFTHNATHSLNLAIYGLFHREFVRPGDHLPSPHREHYGPRGKSAERDAGVGRTHPEALSGDRLRRSSSPWEAVPELDRQAKGSGGGLVLQYRAKRSRP